MDLIHAYRLVNNYMDRLSYTNSCVVHVAAEANPLVSAISTATEPFCIKAFTIPAVLADATEIAIAHQVYATPSSFGQGDRTVYDERVRQAVEVAASALSEQEARIIEYLASCHLYHTMKTLMPHRNLDARLHKIVYYGPGGHFNEHVDTVREDNHVGTLIILLNSSFEGGALVVRQGVTEHRIDKPGEYMALFGDCAHRVEPVTSGMRIALVYDLVTNDDGQAEQDHDFDECRKVLGSYGPRAVASIDPGLIRAELQTYTDIGIVLRHSYPACQMTWAGLKGSDRALYNTIAQTDYAVTFQPFAINDSWTEHDGRSIRAVPYTLEAGHDATGKRVCLYVPYVLPDESLLKHTPYIEHTGNECQPEARAYVHMALMIAPK